MLEYAEAWLSERVRRHQMHPMTARNYRSSLRGFALFYGDQPLRELQSDDIEAWLESRGYLTAATRRGDLSALRGFSHWLVRQHVIATNPTDDVERIKVPDAVPRALDRDQVAMLLDVCPDARARAIVWLQVGLGLRCSEVARLHVEDWSRRAGVLLVHGKGSRDRELPVVADVTRALAEYLREWPTPRGPLIRSYRTPRALRPDTISGMVSEWMRAAGIKLVARDGVSAHALRHTAASDVLEQSKDLRAVQDMLGHRQLATTAIYLRRASLGRLRDAMEGRAYDAA
jgi:integrase/recombinase XerC